MSKHRRRQRHHHHITEKFKQLMEMLEAILDPNSRRDWEILKEIEKTLAN